MTLRIFSTQCFSHYYLKSFYQLQEVHITFRIWDFHYSLSVSILLNASMILFFTSFNPKCFSIQFPSVLSLVNLSFVYSSQGNPTVFHIIHLNGILSRRRDSSWSLPNSSQTFFNFLRPLLLSAPFSCIQLFLALADFRPSSWHSSSIVGVEIFSLLLINVPSSPFTLNVVFQLQQLQVFRPNGVNNINERSLVSFSGSICAFAPVAFIYRDNWSRRMGSQFF